METADIILWRVYVRMCTLELRFINYYNYIIISFIIISLLRKCRYFSDANSD